MKKQYMASWKKTFMNVFAIYGAVYAGLIGESDILEEETWLGIG